MNLREFFLENFVGDVEYHPRRAVIYLIAAAAAGGLWAFWPTEGKFTPVPLVSALGSLTLLGKGLYLLRPSSEGIGLSQRELVELETDGKRKALPSIPAQAAQMVQDFGTGGLLLWPLLNFGKDYNQIWNFAPRWPVCAIGAFFFGLGWVIRRFTEKGNPHG